MRKRFCDVCEGEISDNAEGMELELGKGVQGYGMSTRLAWTADICQSCIIEAIGKMYVEQLRAGDYVVGISKKTDPREIKSGGKCFHGISLKDHCKQCSGIDDKWLDLPSV